MLEWLKKIINKTLDFFWVKPEETIPSPTLEEEEKEEPTKPIEEDKPLEDLENNEENEDIEMNKDFYDCDLVTGTMDDVDCFSKEDEACYTFFLPVRCRFFVLINFFLKMNKKGSL